MKMFRIAASLLVACLALSACGGQDGGGATPTPSQTGGSPMTTSPSGPDPTDPAATTPAVPPTTVSPTRRPPTSPGTPPPAGTTTLTGTISSGVEPGCLLLDNHLLVGGPRDVLRAGAKVIVTGRVQADLITTCQQGTPFLVETAKPA